MTAVVDSSPLIVLGKVRRLDLLSVLYEEIAIPVAVVDEVLAKTQLVTPDLRQFVEHMRVRAVQSATLVQTLSVDLGEVRRRRSLWRPKSVTPCSSWTTPTDAAWRERWGFG
ncbi:MAG: hypothetical protein HYV93_15120 [Candidatus Rokubacteria bacterium]|nr:hypothetical protein [Candidatus Rokubacteria bacterium]